jgi:hypothetical protein
VDNANYSTAKLGEVDNIYYYGVSCQSSMRGRRLSLAKLRETLGDDYPVAKVRNPPQVLHVRLKAIDGDILGAASGGGQSGGSVQQTGAMKESGDVWQVRLGPSMMPARRSSNTIPPSWLPTR